MGERVGAELSLISVLGFFRSFRRWETGPNTSPTHSNIRERSEQSIFGVSVFSATIFGASRCSLSVSPVLRFRSFSFVPSVACSLCRVCVCVRGERDTTSTCEASSAVLLHLSLLDSAT